MLYYELCLRKQNNQIRKSRSSNRIAFSTSASNIFSSKLFRYNFYWNWKKTPKRRRCVLSFQICTLCTHKGFSFKACPQQGDLRLSGPPPGQALAGRARNCDGRPCRSQGGFVDHCPPLPRLPPPRMEKRISRN
ncbi:hypothetical protein PoB_006375700 [Plakobranchus ocellatus]|uniref:Uncharacterized protein n=1 Tax=Plakobranchus ocellatus TaxID=259542 RepID=A0AAV4CZ82_9GAST|nr:hypothetical protein PoB_006375700 [Plakobranchus ocellatus]